VIWGHPILTIVLGNVVFLDNIKVGMVKCGKQKQEGTFPAKWGAIHL
jgi:hypothetical protein